MAFLLKKDCQAFNIEALRSYISDKNVSRNTIQAIRGVYGRYGLTYYLDLLANVYLDMYWK